MKLFYNLFLFSNLYIAFGFCALWIYYAFKLDVNFSLLNLGFFFSSTLISYNLLRFIPFKRGHFIKDELRYFYYHYINYFLLLSFLFIIILISTLSSLSFLQLSIIGMSGLILLFYERVIAQFSLRKVLYIKPFIIVFIWAIICTLIHIEQISHYLKLILNFFYCFFFILILCFSLDFKDRSEDRENNIITLANSIPEKAYLTFILILFILFLCVSLEWSFENMTISLTSLAIFIYANIKAYSKKISYPKHILLIDGLLFIHFLRIFNL